MRRSLWIDVGICFLLVAAAFIVFGRALGHDFAPIDDTLLVRENLAIRGFTLENLRYVFTHFDPEIYIPLTFVSFQLNYVLGGLDPFGYHFFNILLHGVNAALVFIFLKRLLPHRGFAVFGALLFALHPLQTEAVVWIAGRKDLLFTFFYLLTLIAYLHYRGGSWLWYGASILLALCAMLSKATAMTIPAVLLLFDLLIERRHLQKSLADKLPFALLAIIFALVAILGKERVVGSTSILETLLVAFRSAVHYIQKFFVPMDLSVFYQYRGGAALTDPRILFSLILVLLLLAAAWRYRKRAPWFGFGLLFYLITLSPTFLNFHKGLISFYAVDRYAYLPLTGIIFVVVSAASLVTRRSWVLVPGGVSILIFGSLAMMQTRVWDSAETLYTHAVVVDPASVPARATLAQVLRQLSRPLEAFEVLKEGLPYGDDVSYHLEAGNIYAAVGQVSDAIDEFMKAAQMSPYLPEPIFSIGSLEEHRGNIDLALEYYRKAIVMDPSYVGARVRIADITLDRGDLEEAEKQLQEGLKWNPSYYSANVQMARLRELQGRPEDAAIYREKADALRGG